MEARRRLNVIPVIGLDLRQQHRISALAPLLVEHNTCAGILDLAFARRPVEVLNVFDRIARL